MFVQASAIIVCSSKQKEMITVEKDFKEILKAKPVFDEEILRAAEEGKLIFFLWSYVKKKYKLKMTFSSRLTGC